MTEIDPIFQCDDTPRMKKQQIEGRIEELDAAMNDMHLRYDRLYSNTEALAQYRSLEAERDRLRGMVG